MVPVVQLVRASDCGSECRGFESHRAPQRRHRRKAMSFFVRRPKTSPKGNVFFCAGLRTRVPFYIIYRSPKIYTTTNSTNGTNAIRKIRKIRGREISTKRGRYLSHPTQHPPPARRSTPAGCRRRQTWLLGTLSPCCRSWARR